MVGGAGFQLRVRGIDFATDAQVCWNGSPRSTSFVNSGELSAAILGSDLATAGSGLVTVTIPGRPTSIALPLLIKAYGAPGLTVRWLDLAAKALVWDASRQVIYASVPGSAGTQGRSLAIVDPASATVRATVPVAGEPSLLALSDPPQYLYATLATSSIQRFQLPGLTADLKVALGSDPNFGSYEAIDLQAAPGAPETFAVSRGGLGRGPGLLSWGGLVVYDRDVPRLAAPGLAGDGTAFDRFQWGLDTSRIYAMNADAGARKLFVLGVDPVRATLLKQYDLIGTGSPGRLLFDRGAGLLYTDQGKVLDPGTGAEVGSFPVQGVKVPDATLGRVFFLGTVGTGVDTGGSALGLMICDQQRFTLLTTILLADVPGSPVQVIRYGSDGLAFATTAGRIYFLSGPALTN
jgi:hypothetical protein